MKKEFISKLIQEKSRKGRTSWKYKNVTRKQQLTLLSKNIRMETIQKLDRGTANLLIAKIIDEELQTAPYRSIASRGWEDF